MARKTVIAGMDITASQLKEFFALASTEGSHVNRGTLQAYLERRNPFVPEWNENGHAIITFQGTDLTGKEEVERLEGRGIHVCAEARQSFVSTRSDGYDTKHRLLSSCGYKVALVPAKEVESAYMRTTENFLKLGMKRYGYGKPFAGHTPRICENISNREMEDLGIRHVVVLHDPISDHKNFPQVLAVDRGVGGGRKAINARWVDPRGRWDDDVSFAFPVVKRITR